MTKEKLEPVKKKKLTKDNTRELVLFNDEVNTFEFVIETLVEVCGHDPQQAEQCAMVAHYNGKCTVKSGTVVELKPPYKEMINRKLTVSIT